ncbi:MAG: hypothetical protein GC181_07285 [Bacteroidetes bacterium]|nr:hypothetical protein [Bacteroidota bacterium]
MKLRLLGFISQCVVLIINTNCKAQLASPIPVNIQSLINFNPAFNCGVSNKALYYSASHLVQFDNRCSSPLNQLHIEKCTKFGYINPGLTINCRNEKSGYGIQALNLYISGYPIPIKPGSHIYLRYGVKIGWQETDVNTDAFIHNHLLTSSNSIKGYRFNTKAINAGSGLLLCLRHSVFGFSINHINRPIDFNANGIKTKFPISKSFQLIHKIKLAEHYSRGILIHALYENSGKRWVHVDLPMQISSVHLFSLNTVYYTRFLNKRRYSFGPGITNTQKTFTELQLITGIYNRFNLYNILQSNLVVGYKFLKNSDEQFLTAQINVVFNFNTIKGLKSNYLYQLPDL